MSTQISKDEHSDRGADECWPMSDQRWDSLCKRISRQSKDCDATDVFGDAAKRGAVYRWGVAAATGQPCSDLVRCLSRMACGAKRRKGEMSSDLLAQEIEAFAARINGGSPLGLVDASQAVLCGAALAGLTRELDQSSWSQLLKALELLREAILERGRDSSPFHLIIGGELGLTLAWRLSPLQDCKRMGKSSLDAVKAWCKLEEESIAAAIRGGTDARLVLASLIRCQRIIENQRQGKVTKRQLSMGRELAYWAAAMTTEAGGTAFGDGERKLFRDDLASHGLLVTATGFDTEALQPAVAATLGEVPQGGRLAWEVSLPESIHHDADAKICVMFPEWDVRRGRTHIDYSQDELKIEVFTERGKGIGGVWQTEIDLDDQKQQSCGDWEEVCEYSDDDVHYLEIEQPWSGGLLLQRQFMLIRDDRCLLLADSILPSEDQGTKAPGARRQIRYTTRLPLSPDLNLEPEKETRELYLNDGRRRGMVIPLAANEWLVGPTAAKMKESDDHHLLLTAQGSDRLYSPIWIDFQQRRYKRKRTWRQLTVADELRIVGPEESVAYRIQMGSEQWVLYRSLADDRCRTFLGKHLIASFFASRFDPGDGSHEELLTVDDSDKDDE